MNYRSEKVEALYSALSIAQGDFLVLEPNANSSSGPYADLAAVLAAVKFALKANGLSVYHQTQLDDEKNLLWSNLAHSSGQYVSTCTRIMQGKSFRDTFTSIESHKRLNTCNLFQIAPSPNDPLFVDDHGQDEVDIEIIKSVKKNEKPPISHFPETVNRDQYNDLLFELEGQEKLAKDILTHYKISSFADLPKSEYHTALARIRRVKRTFEDYLARKK